MKKKKFKPIKIKPIPHDKPFEFSFFPRFLGEKNESYWLQIANDKINDNKKKLENVYFSAFYYGDDDLRVFPIVRNLDGDTAIVPYPGYILHTLAEQSNFDGFPENDLPFFLGEGMKDSWEVFYETASFFNIISTMSGEWHIRDFTQQEVDRVITKINDDKTDAIKKHGDLHTIGKRDESLLKLIIDKPMVLHNDKIRSRFIDILNIARWGSNTENKNKAYFLIKDCFLCLHKGGKKRLLPDVNYKLAVILIKLLAKHLSKICRNILIDHGYNEKADLSLDSDRYKILMKWVDKSPYEYRINLPIKSLQLLIKSPSKYIDNLLLKEFNASQKTITRRSK